MFLTFGGAKRLLLLRWRAVVALTAVGALTFLVGSASAVPRQSSEDYLESPLTSMYASHRGGNGHNPAQIAKKGEAVGIRLVGFHNLGGGGFNADVWVHRNIAYVGQWGFGATQPDKCQTRARRGVKVVDVTNPAVPQLIARLNNPDLTTAEDVEVITYTSGLFRGRDIAAVGIQACFRRDTTVPRGLQLWDVTDPAHPVKVGFLDTGRGAFSPDPGITGGPSRGVHELTVVPRPDGRVLALLTVPFSDTRDALSRGDLRIADISDPAHPVELASWGLATEYPHAKAVALQLSGQGCFPFRFGHGALANPTATRAYISYWDWGTKILDISDPATPVLLGTTGFPANADGDSHSAALSADGAFLLTGDEDIPPPGFCKAPAKHTEAGWGFLRIFQLSEPVQQVATFKTPNSTEPARNRKGDYSIHNPFVIGTKAYLSWYTDGLRVVDISSPFSPWERAHFVPPAAKDPQHILPFAAEVWGVVVDERGYVYLSDMNSGLWIVRETNP